MESCGYPKVLPDEIAVRAVVPALRASVAKALIGKHGLTQHEVAKLLGVTQAAVSHYLSDKRGAIAQAAVHAKEVRKICAEIAAMLAGDAYDQRMVVVRFSNALSYIKAHRLMCDIHKQFEPEVNLTACHICDTLLKKA